jgi:hypothetical protein
MIINPLDKSNYFKGLLVLAGKEKEISINEKFSLQNVAAILGFDHNFVNKAIDDFFKNKYITEEPPMFSDSKFAEIFIKDGVKLAFADKALSIHQIEWLTATALKNKLSKQWVFIELENFLDNYSPDFIEHFEIQKIADHNYKGSSYIY